MLAEQDHLTKAERGGDQKWYWSYTKSHYMACCIEQTKLFLTLPGAETTTREPAQGVLGGGMVAEVGGLRSDSQTMTFLDCDFQTLRGLGDEGRDGGDTVNRRKESSSQCL